MSSQDFDPPPVTDQAKFMTLDEPDTLTGNQEYFHVLPRILLADASHFATLAAALEVHQLHPICHNFLLHGIAAKASQLGPLRVLPPPASVVDRVWDCRIRSWADVTDGKQAGDQTIGISPGYEDCLVAVTMILGDESEWLIKSDEVGIAGAQGTASLNLMIITEGDRARQWEEMRKGERCLRSPGDSMIR